MKTHFINSNRITTTTLFFCVFTCLEVLLSLTAHAQVARGFDLGTVNCNERRCGRIFIVNNQATPLTLEGIDSTGASNFQRDSAMVFPVAIAVGDSISIPYCVQSTTVGRITQPITFLFSGGNAFPVPFTVSVVAPRLVLNPSTLDFGTIVQNQVSCRAVAVLNSGDAPLTINSPSGLVAPFTIISPLPRTIQPAQSDTIIVCFQPTTVSNFTQNSIFAYSACRTNETLILRGNGAAPPPNNIGGVLQINPISVNIDTTLCGTQKCVQVEFRNTGTSGVLIRSVEQNLTAPFSTIGNFINQTIPVNGLQNFQVCFQSSQISGQQFDTLVLRADTRQSLNILTLFDVSGSMGGQISINDPTVRIVAARQSGNTFIDLLINDAQRQVVDQAAVYSFSSPSSSFSRVRDFSSDKNLLKAGIATLTPSGGTCLYDAIQQAVAVVALRPNPVIVVLSDGEDGCGGNLAQTIAIANAARVRIFVIGITDNTTAQFANDLRSIGTQTGGGTLFAATGAQLTEAFIQISQLLSQNVRIAIPVRARSVAPLLTVTPVSIAIDSTLIGTERCTNVLVRNSGDAPVTLSPQMFTTSNSQFVVRNLPVAALNPNEERTFQMCFVPTALRTQTAPASFTYNSCRPLINLPVSGIGYDSVVFTFDGQVQNLRPNSIFSLPLRINKAIPTSYSVDSMSVTIEANRTLVNPTNSPLRRTGFPTTAFTSSVTSSVFDASRASFTFRLEGGRLLTTANQVVDSLQLAVLNGDAMSTDISLLSVRLADGNPKVGIITPARMSLDSTCFQAFRLTRSLSVTIFNVRSNDAGDAVEATIQTQDASRLRVTLLHQFGQILSEQTLSAQPGSNYVTLSLPSYTSAGLYFLRVANENGVTDTQPVVLVR